MGRVHALCISENKGERKTPLESAVFRAGHGIENDAHAGAWHRQVSLLSEEDIAEVRARIPDVVAGSFAENVVVSEMDLSAVGVGSRLRLGGEVTLTITQIGKECHAPCRIYHLTGDCIMPRLGVFATVDVGGAVNLGDTVAVLELKPREEAGEKV